MRQCYAIAVLVGSVLLGCGGPGGDTSIPWSASIPLGIERAADDQVLFVYFQAEWCHVCRQMDEQTFHSAEVVRALSAFVPVKIDVDEQPRTTETYLATVTPAYMLVDKQGTVRARSVGFLTAAEMVQFLDQSARLLDEEQSVDAVSSAS